MCYFKVTRSDGWARVSAGHAHSQLCQAAIATATGKGTFSKGPWEPQEGVVPLPRWMSAAWELSFGRWELWDKCSRQGFLS